MVLSGFLTKGMIEIIQEVVYNSIGCNIYPSICFQEHISFEDHFIVGIFNGCITEILM